MKEIVWNPADHSWVAERRIAQFMRLYGISDWRECIQRSRGDIRWFWARVILHIL